MGRRALFAVAVVGLVAVAGGGIGLAVFGSIPPSVAVGTLSDSGLISPVRFDESSAVEINRDAYTVTERDGSGLMRATVSQQVSSVLRDGVWVPISTDLAVVEGGGVSAADHPLEPVFASAASETGLVRVQNAGYSLSMSLEGVDPVPVTQVAASADVADGTAVRYEGALDGSDLRFEVGQQGLYQTVVLEAAPVVQPRYVWVMDSPGLLAEQHEAGNILFVTPNGDVIFDVPGPVMWDSLGGDGGMAESASTPVAYTLASAEEGRWNLTLQPDLGWLGDPARVYPVSVDPSIYPGSGMVATYKESNYTYNYASVPRIGNTKETSTCCAWRTVLRYPLNDYFGKRVTSASLVANWTYGTTTTQPASVWWATAFNFNGKGSKIADFSIARQGIAAGGVFNMVASILNNSDQYSYLMLTGQESNSIYGRKDLSTYVTFTYVNPAVVTGVTGATPKSAAVGPLTQAYVDDVVMQATGTNSTPGTSQVFQYKFVSSNGGVAFNTGWQAAGPFRVPEAALTPGKDYTYTIETKDTGTGSPVKTGSNATWKFHTRSAPNVPTNVTVNGESLTATVVSSVTRPVIAATVSDPDGPAGGAVWALFTITQDGIVIMDSVPGSVPETGSDVSSVTLPYGITSGVDYQVLVRAFDGHLAGDSFAPPGKFTGPPRSVRELPTPDDTNTGATP